MQNIEIDKLTVSDLNVRKICNLNDESFLCLKESIRSVGLIEPIVVREKNGQFEIIAGQRRFYACKALRDEAIEKSKKGEHERWMEGKYETPCEVRNMSDREALEISLIENLNRADVDPFDIANAIKRLCDEYSNGESKNSVVEAVGKKVGLSRSMTWKYIGLLEATDEIKNMVSKKELSMKTANKIAAMPQEKQAEAAEAIKALPSEALQEKALKEIKHSKDTPQNVVGTIFAKSDVLFEVRAPDMALYTFKIPDTKFAAIKHQAKKDMMTVAEHLEELILEDCAIIENSGAKTAIELAQDSVKDKVKKS